MSTTENKCAGRPGRFCNFKAIYGETKATYCKKCARSVNEKWIDDKNHTFKSKTISSSNNSKGIKYVQETEIGKKPKNIIEFRNDSPGDYFFMSTYHEKEFIYECRLDNNNQENVNPIRFRNIEQGAAFISYCSQPPPNNAVGRKAVTDILNSILLAKNVSEIKKITHKNNYKGKISTGPASRNNWNHSFGNLFPVSYLFMFELYVEKFKQNPELKKMLMKTGDSIIREISSDSYMGIGSNGEGKNLLGNLLMCIRKFFESEINYDDYVEKRINKNNDDDADVGVDDADDVDREIDADGVDADGVDADDVDADDVDREIDEDEYKADDYDDD